jgi:hypothetical protein
MWPILLHLYIFLPYIHAHKSYFVSDIILLSAVGTTFLFVLMPDIYTSTGQRLCACVCMCVHVLRKKSIYIKCLTLMDIGQTHTLSHTQIHECYFVLIVTRAVVAGYSYKGCQYMCAHTHRMLGPYGLHCVCVCLTTCICKGHVQVLIYGQWLAHTHIHTFSVASKTSVLC